MNLPESVRETDSKVYRIIDRTWDKNEIPEHSQYRISEDEPITSLSQITNLLAADNQTLPLNSALILAVSNNRQYQQEKEQLYLTALDQVAIEHLYEGTWLAEGESELLRDDNNETIENSGSLTFSKLLATGARITGGLSIGCIDIISGDLRSGLSVVASTAITQPLLRGAGRKVALENLTQSQRNTLYQIRSFNRFRQSLATEIISDYYNILLKYQLKQNYASHYEQVKSFAEKNKTRAAAGRVSTHEMEQANQDTVQALTDYISTAKEYEDALDNFKHKLVLPSDMDIMLDISELDLLREYIDTPLELTETNAIELALTQRLDVLNAVDTSEDAQRKVEIAADAIRAELNLVGYAQSETTGLDSFGASASDLRRSQERYSLALQLDLPLDRLAEKNAYRKALIEVVSAQRDQQELTEKVALEIRENYRKILETKEIYQNELNGLKLARQRSGSTELLIQYGRANTRDVLDAQKDLLSSQQRATEALVDYAIANLNLVNNTGLLRLKNENNWYKSL